MGAGRDDDTALASTEVSAPDALGDTHAQASAPRPSPEPFVKGARVGHFVVLGKLGAGGMGMVVAAYDPDLERKVALKILRPEMWGGTRGEPAKRRLLREAQAMAKLSHPNVVSVFEVGTIDRELFVAMEYVDGTTLTRWLRDGERSWREIIAAFAAAGEGLAAAHRAGMVHRDFKPDNVLVGSDGVVRVTDFGLVGSIGRSSAEMAAAGGEASPDLGLTATGALMGTPVYMAPEQHASSPTDARADQFSFCVALYEALYRQRPFSGTSYAELARSVLAGELRPPPADTDVPGWVHDVLVRGLRLDPAERHDDMTQLLAALRRDPAGRRRRWYAVAGVAALAGVALFGWLRSPAGAPPVCSAAGDRIAQVWNEDARAEVRAAFDAADVPYAADGYRVTAALIDGYTAQWAAMRVEACEATHVRGEQSDALLDARMACLDDRLRAVEELAGALKSADAAAVEHAVAAASSLPSLARCADTRALARLVPPPTDAGEVAQIAVVQTRLARAKALRDTGDYAGAIEVAEEAVTEAEPIAYAPLRALAHYTLADARDWGGDTEGAEASAHAAMQAALAARDDELLVKSATLLVWVVGVAQTRFAEAHRWARMADASLGEGGDPVARADLLCNEGSVYQAAGELDAAVAALRRCLELREAALPAGHISTAKAYLNLGNAHSARADLDDAIAYHERALAAFEASVGAQHPHYAAALNSLGASLLDRHGVHGDGAALARGAELLERALVVRRATLGPDHPLTIDTLTNVANARQYQGRHAEALAHYDEVTAFYTEAFGPEHPQVATAHYNRGLVLSQLGRRDDAIAAFTSARDVWAAALGPTHVDVGRAEASLAVRLSEAGRHREAAEGLERALAIRLEAGVSPRLIAMTRFDLARELWTLGDRRRALTFARQAIAEYPVDSEADRAWVADARAWLAEREN